MRESMVQSRGGISSGSTERSRTAVSSPHVLLIELTNERQFTSNGGGVYVAHLVGPVLKGLGPHMQEIKIHSLGRGFSANFKYKITAERSYDGETWNAFTTAVLAEQTAVGYVISSAYTTTGDFGMMIRFRVEVSDTAAAKEVGILSVTAAVRLWH